MVAVQHRSVLAEGIGHLATAKWPWLLAAACATCLTWVAAAVTRQGAVIDRLPRLRLLVTQFAAGSANHLLPTGLGASAVNLRFMTVCGLPLARSSAALALYLLAESVARVGLLAALLIAFPHALQLGPLLPEGAWGPLLLIIGAAAIVIVAVFALVRRLRTAVFSFLRTALDEARSVHTRPSRALALWGGSLAFPALQASGLVLVGLATGLDVPPAHMALAYLAATVAVALGADAGRARLGRGGADRGAGGGGRPGCGGDGGRAGVPDHHGVAAAAAGGTDAGGARALQGHLIEAVRSRRSDQGARSRRSDQGPPTARFRWKVM